MAAGFGLGAPGQAVAEHDDLVGLGAHHAVAGLELCMAGRG